jgi:thymidylate synthase (FAD)
MFKTIQECRLDLVAHSVHAESVAPNEYPVHRVGEDMDFMSCSAARVSFGNEDKTGQDVEKDRKLMKYLAEHQHMTPFEYQHATFLIECPLFIRSQIHRHRTFSFNEISRRYTDENLEFWIPDKFRGQSKSNRQASDGVCDEQAGLMIGYQLQLGEALHTYEWLLEHGVAREQARAVLPQSLLTKFYMGGNLRNWAHCIELRRDGHAQPEVQVIVNRVAEKLRELWPESCAALGI